MVFSVDSLFTEILGLSGGVKKKREIVDVCRSESAMVATVAWPAIDVAIVVVVSAHVVKARALRIPRVVVAAWVQGVAGVGWIVCCWIIACWICGVDWIGLVVAGRNYEC